MSPFVSERQRRWMWANHPDMARRWAEEEKRARAENDEFWAEFMLRLEEEEKTWQSC